MNKNIKSLLIFVFCFSFFFSAAGNCQEKADDPTGGKRCVTRFALSPDPKMLEGRLTHCDSPEEEAQALVEMFKKKGVKKIAAFVFNRPETRALFTNVKNTAEKNSMRVVFVSVVNQGDVHFRKRLRRAKGSRPDVCLAFLFSPELEIFTEQFENFNIFKPLTSVEFFGDSSLPRFSKDGEPISKASVTKDSDEKREDDAASTQSEDQNEEEQAEERSE